MTTILRIDASSRTTSSISRSVGDYFEQSWLTHNPRDLVLRRDVVTDPITHIAQQTITGFYTPADRLTDELQTATALSDRLIAELQAADMLLLTVPMYNFAVPSAFKAWIDHIVRIGHTFTYDGSSFSGLLTGRRAYVVTSHGAAGYRHGDPFAAADFLVPYLRFILQFLGITDVHVFAVEGTTGDELTLTAAIERAKREIDAVVAAASIVPVAAA
ncbi:MAG: NAD(P)H-dependent oxidoreductase [Propionibacteriaceae bacterium]|nr:NAD(P)H-dependent oxidoreductase [Propionibacteriaceae bacterium]